MFRAFLHLTKKECDDMLYQDYLDYQIMLVETWKKIHAPYMNDNQ